MNRDDAVQHTVQILTAHLTSTPTTHAALPDLIRKVHATVLSLVDLEPEDEDAERVPVRAAAAPDVTPEQRAEMTVEHDHIICLECGGKVVLLKPHLRDKHLRPPDVYLEKWQLPDDYPMSPQAYRERKREIALQRDLGAVGRARRAEKQAQQRELVFFRV